MTASADPDQLASSDSMAYPGSAGEESGKGLPKNIQMSKQYGLDMIIYYA